jgi:hypothetical protein
LVAADFLRKELTMAKHKKRHLADAYRFDGFMPQPCRVRGLFGAPKARVLPLLRRSKKRSVTAAQPCITVGMTARQGWCAICPVATHMSTWKWKYGVFSAERAAK